MREWSLKLTSIPEIQFTFENRSDLVIRQYFIEKDDTAIFDSYLSLAKDIDRMHADGLIHGDSHQRNVVTKDSICYLIDFEHCYLRQRHDMRVKMSARFSFPEFEQSEKLLKLVNKMNFTTFFLHKMGSF
ncbi:MAG: lipopolysaccharide kinase InaA family protein [Gracilimonas sp.]|nr:lipopolysaccharide kinase InaA family protein [Gracilimonas sp.]